jgi:hypothetical protein
VTGGEHPVGTRFPPGAILACGATIVSLLLLLGPVLGQPTRLLLGNVDSEAPAHLHWLLAALEGLGRHGPFVLSASPLGLEPTDALMDPGSVLLMAPISAAVGGGLTGATLAWNLLPALGLLGAAAGAWLWSRTWLGDEDPGAWGAGLAAALAASSLWTLHQVEVGRSECFLYPAFVLHGALLFGALRGGSRGRWLGAGASLLPMAWCGLSSLPLLLLMELLVVAWALRGRPAWRPTAVGLASTAAVGALACLPLLLALGAHPPPSAGDLEARVPGASASLRSMLMGQADLLQGLPGYEVVPWLGWALLLGAVLAGLRWRRARLPLLLAALLWAICAGPWPRVGITTFPGPAALFEALPEPLGLIRGWVRLLGMLAPVVAVLAAAAALRRPWVAVALTGLALGEAALRSTGPRTSMTLAPPTAAETLRNQGTVALELPRDRLALARRAVLGPSQPDPWSPDLDPGLMMLLDGRIGNPPRAFQRGDEPTFTPDELRDLRRRMAKLRGLGLHGVLLRPHSLVPGTRERAHLLLDAIACSPAPSQPDYWSLPASEDAPSPDALEAPDSSRIRRSLGETLD